MPLATILMQGGYSKCSAIALAGYEPPCKRSDGNRRKHKRPLRKIVLHRKYYSVLLHHSIKVQTKLEHPPIIHKNKISSNTINYPLLHKIKVKKMVDWTPIINSVKIRYFNGLNVISHKVFTWKSDLNHLSHLVRITSGKRKLHRLRHDPFMSIAGAMAHVDDEF